jgi:hypothetical protein
MDQEIFNFYLEYSIPTLVNLYSSKKNLGVPDESLWYQQDGTSPHYALHVQRYLDQVFPNRRIGPLSSRQGYQTSTS